MEMTLEQLSTEHKKTFEHFKEQNDKALAQVKANGEASSETKEQITRLNSRLDGWEVKMKRVSLAADKTLQDESAVEHKKVFGKFLRKGAEALSPEERKTLLISDDTTGGFLATSEMAGEIDKDIVEFSPIRSLARVTQIGTRSLLVPRRTGTFAAAWVGEGQTQAETTGLTYGMEEIHAHPLRALVQISLENLEDPQFSLESELRMEFAEQFGVAEGAAFVNGNGVGRPEGFRQVASNGVNERETAGSLALDGDDFIDLMMTDVKSFYWPNGMFGMNRKIIAEVRKLKDVDGQYLWQPGLNGPTQSTLLGRTIVEMTDMQSSTGPLVAGEQVAIFADFRRFYWIIDRIGMAVTRDPFTLADQGLVRFIARKRLGGQVTRAEAGSILKIKA